MSDRFRRFFKNLRSLDHRHYICSSFLLVLVLWSVFICRDSYIRLWESCRDFVTSFADLVFYSYDWCPEPSVKEISSIDIVTLIPQSWVDFAHNFEIFKALFFDKNNILGYLLWILPLINAINQILLFVLLFGVIYWVLKRFLKPSVVTDPDRSRSLGYFLNFRKYVLLPLRDYIRNLYNFFVERKYYFRTFLVIFCFSTNLVSIVIAFFAVYFYFCSSLDILNLAVQLYKLSVDILVTWKTLPAFLWSYIAWRIFNYFCRKIAFKKLRAKELLNKEIVRSLGLITLIVAPMRGGKTKLESSMSVTNAEVLREDMLENMLQVHSHFPHFPFEIFIHELNVLVSSERLKSLRLCEIYVEDLRESYLEDPCPERLFGYDGSSYPMSCDNGLVVIDLFEDLSVFVKSFSVYSQPTLFAGNYSVRDLHVLTTKGNFPLWDFNLFNKPSFDGSGTFSRKLNFDCLRPGKKVGDDPTIYGLLEYGTLHIQEADKEFGNKTDMEEMKVSSKTANMKNDMHNKFFKTMGHAGMINYKATLRVFMDSQRKSSLGADAHELGLICKILDSSEERLTLPFFVYRDLLYRLVKNLHKKFKSSRWHNRADTTLPGYLIDGLFSRYIHYCEVVHNTFGYNLQHLQIYEGTEEGEKLEVSWFAMNKKEKGGLYATDGLREMFRQHNARSGKGFSDLPQFDTLHPSLKSMQSDLNSFMINSFCKENEDDVTNRSDK